MEDDPDLVFWNNAAIIGFRDIICASPDLIS
jgi:hypothetical protein